MKKNYFSTLFAALMLFLAIPATAQVATMADFYGKWKFTATITTTEAGAEHADKFKSDCEVVIAKAASQYFMADITGFAGADYSMSVSGFDASANTIEINGPNNANYGIWNGYIAVANAAGDWPFSIWDVEGSEQYAMNFTFDPETKEITIPDFTTVSLDWGTNTATILANVTNAKLTPVELEVKDTSKYPDLTGLWTWEGGLREENNDPKSFTVEFAQAGEGKDAWKATFTFGEYEPFTLDATFDGTLVTAPHDTIFLDRENGIRFGTRTSSKEYASAFTFSYNSKTSMSLYDYPYVRRDSIHPETGELVGAFIHQVFDGYLTREDPDAYDWSGTYKVKARDIENYTDTVTFPAEFDMVIEKKPGNLYYITEMLGYKDLSIAVTPADDDKSVSINLGGYAGASLEYLGEVNGDWAYHVVTDINNAPTSMTMTKNEDGSFSFSDFSVSYKLYTAGTYDPITDFYGATATKEVFDWAGDYTLTATVETVEGATVDCPAEFNVTVELGQDGKYRIMNFMGVDFYALNQGGTILNVAENNGSATFALNQAWGYCFVAGAYPDYLTMNDKDGGQNAMSIVLGKGNVLTMDDFTVNAFNWDSNTSSKIATYSNVTLTKKPAPTITLTAEVVEGTERTFEFASTVAGTVISIDWGNGEIVVADTLTEAYDGWNQTPVTGTPVGNGEIKIYATGDLCYFDCVSRVDGPGITKLDVSKATELTKLYANGNKLTSVDVSMLSKLETLYLNNNSLTEVKDLPASLTSELNLGNNKLESLDVSNLTSLVKLTVSDNATLTALDISNCAALNQLFALNCDLTSFTAGAVATPNARINVNNNKLETLDLSEATGLGTLFAMGNNLTEIKFPDVELSSANISKNKFTLATIPATAKVKTLTYAPQQDMTIEDIKGTIDLSAQNNLVGLATEAQATTYTWLTEAGDTLVAGVDYTEEAGKFTFIKDQTQKVYCTMTTEAFPKFTSANIFKTVAVAVVATETGIDGVEADVELAGDIYTVDGKLVKRNASVADMPKGLYIVKTAAGKAVKVIRK